MKYQETNILLSGRVNADSKILYVREPKERVEKVAPWLTLDGDPYPDVFARSGVGMRTYSSAGTGHFVRTIRWGTGWGGFTQLSTGADWNGDGVADLMAVNPRSNAGTLIFYAGTGKRDFQTRPAAFPTVPGADLVRLVGDVNGDGYTDAVARVRTTGTLVILRGMSGSRFAAPLAIGGRGWNGPNMIEPAGDYDYDGVPDLLVRDTSGNLHVYPLRRDLRFKTRMVVGSGFGGMLSVVGVGAFNTDANGDVIALRGSDHALILYRGAGPAPLKDSSMLRTGRSDLEQILGVGDYNGDRTADVLARSSTGRLWIYPGDGKGGLAGGQPVRGGEETGHVLG